MYLYMANQTYNELIYTLFVSKTLKTLTKILVNELLFKNMFRQLNIKTQEQIFFFLIAKYQFMLHWEKSKVNILPSMYKSN